MDPLGTALGTVALVAPFFNACKKLRKGYRLTQTFGEDYLVVSRLIDTQYARLEQLSKRPVRDLAGFARIDVHDENDPKMKKLISVLAEMKKHSDECTNLIHRYHGTYILERLRAYSSIFQVIFFFRSPFQGRLIVG